LCGQEVEIDKLRTKVYNSVSTPTLPPPAPMSDMFQELSDDDRKRIQEFLNESLDKQNAAQEKTDAIK
jgi:hypothetical protein